MNKVEHIGIAVQDLIKANLVYSQILGTEPYKTEQVTSEKVITSFFRCGESKIELLAATDETSVIANFIQKRGEGIHHIAFAVEDIEAEMNRLKQAGFTLLNETPKPGADNKLICFVHPKNTNGVLIELCQERT
ncbi:MAG: methylmalonyl-CoA epimerase [Bacteroidota bacterium]|nr:methylmalonyl-CoA epimerase [Bacteroidota bacterium]